MIKTAVKESSNKSMTPLSLRWKMAIIGGIVLLAVILGESGSFDFLIPGDNAVTRAAFGALVEDVKEGESVKTAITTFCMEILDGAEISQD